LTQERIVDAAVEYADAHGIEALSMRRLARELGVEAMSLYNHVANKDQILDEMVQSVMTQVEMPGDTSDWRAAIRAWAISRREAMLRHPWTASLSGSRRSGEPSQLRQADWLLRTLREAGLDPVHVYHAYHLLEAYVLGYVVLQLSVDVDREELEQMADRFLQKLPHEEYPDFAEHVRGHMEAKTGEGGFELGLDLILEGLERLVREAASCCACSASRAGSWRDLGHLTAAYTVTARQDSPATEKASRVPPTSESQPATSPPIGANPPNAKR
jgi:AcrR family transcriptional regulator